MDSVEEERLDVVPEQVPEDVGDETAEDADKERKEEGFQETVPVLFLSRHD